MRNINFLIIFVCFISLLFIQSIFALSAGSENHSVGKFGTGLIFSNSLSSNYETLSFSESQGTTRNAKSYTYTSNIGFFSNTSYHTSISISSYSVYPSSAVRGSIIRFSISVLNYENIWVVLTLPDSTQETIQLLNTQYFYYTASTIGHYTLKFYANNSAGDISSVIDSFDITSPTSPPVSPPSGGGTKIIKEECTYIWDCTSWGICLDKKQERECANIGNCTGIEGKPLESRECSDALFDVIMKLNQLEVQSNESIKFNIDLKETKGIEKIDVQIKYSIINSNNTEIFSQTETRAVEGNLSYEKEINEMKLLNGKYKLRVEILYGNLQRAFSEQNFELITKEKETGWNETRIPQKEGNKFLNTKYKLLLIIASLFVLLFLGILLVKLYSIIKIKLQTGNIAIRRLVGKDVYSFDGKIVGEVSGITIDNNKISGLRVRLNNIYDTLENEILINYNYVKSVKKVITLEKGGFLI